MMANVHGYEWSRVPSGAAPPARTAQSSAYADNVGGVALFGGIGDTVQPLRNDLWLWKGGKWSFSEGSGGPPARAFAGLAYDQARQNLVLFGGIDAEARPLNDTWIWDGVSWQQRATPTAPPARTGASLAYDQAQGDVVLFGGAASNGRSPLWLDDTWSWDGSRWTQRHVDVSPGARASASAVYSDTASGIVMFGGSGQSVFGDTWLWRNGTWTPLSPAASPPPRAHAAMAYDNDNQLIILFGGQGVGPTVDEINLADLWTFDGTNWARQRPGSNPHGGFSYAMAYNKADHATLLFRTVVHKTFDPARVQPAAASSSVETWILR